VHFLKLIPTRTSTSIPLSSMLPVSPMETTRTHHILTGIIPLVPRKRQLAAINLGRTCWSGRHRNGLAAVPTNTPTRPSPSLLMRSSISLLRGTATRTTSPTSTKLLLLATPSVHRPSSAMLLLESLLALSELLCPSLTGLVTPTVLSG
jgi:hypothetical protein